jgi:hypothetical protein
MKNKHNVPPPKEEKSGEYEMKNSRMQLSAVEGCVYTPPKPK